MLSEFGFFFLRFGVSRNGKKKDTLAFERKKKMQY
jgi:hypothetical protein